MRTKISLALGKRQPLSRQTAWGCLTSNLAMPGSGSLVAGYRTGYAQMILALVGFALTTIYGLQFITWYIGHSSELTQNHSEPEEALIQMWLHVRWGLLGIGLFFLGWLWALLSSASILSDAKREPRKPVPPKLNP